MTKSGVPIISIGLLCFVVFASQFYSHRPQEQVETVPANSSYNSPNSSQSELRVTKVIDGDTFVLENGSRVRLIGIDTPELRTTGTPPECYSEKVTLISKSLVEGKVVRLEKDTSDKDKYDRLLRYVWVGNTMINKYLVENGYAVTLSIPPDTRYSVGLLESESYAKSKGLGIWSDCPYKNE